MVKVLLLIREGSRIQSAFGEQGSSEKSKCQNPKFKSNPNAKMILELVI
jgi:hypothetical protein